MTDPYLIPQAEHTPYPLGRAGVNHDPRNWDYRALVKPPIARDIPRTSWYSTKVFDQGQEPRCTTEMALGLLETNPFTTQFRGDWQNYLTPEAHQQFYLRSQDFDPWAGTVHSGSSTDAPFKYLKSMGMITGYRWLSGEDELRQWETWFSPAGVGTVWLGNMFYPDPKTFYLDVSGEVVGGHAYRVTGYSPKRDAYIITNSWSREWGHNGRAYISSLDMRSLLKQDGEAITVG